MHEVMNYLKAEPSGYQSDFSFQYFPTQWIGEINHLKIKEHDTGKPARAIREKIIEKTKELTRKELLVRYKKRCREAMKTFRKSSQGFEISD